MVRPRGWHLDEKHFLVDGKPISGSLFDFGLFFFHNAQAPDRERHGPVFLSAQDGEPPRSAPVERRVQLRPGRHWASRAGTIRATVLIETILAAFEMDEILYELREHSAGLNCGRWDYIFSFIKKFRNRPDFVLPDRAEVTMDRHFLNSYVRAADPDLPPPRHSRHGRHGGADSHQERSRGQRKGAGESAPGQAARSPRRARRHLGGASRPGADRQRNLRRAHEDAQPDQPQPRRRAHHRQRICWPCPRARSPKTGLRWNIDVGLQYLEAWLRGNGCVPIYNLMEDAATAEICRAQVWQWVRHGATLSDGRPVTREMVRAVIAEQTSKLKGGRMAEAAAIYEQMMTSPDFAEFLTLVAYDYID